MATTQNIPNTRITGPQTFTVNAVAQPFNNAILLIDRTIAQGLNSLTTADSLNISIDRSTDGGASWHQVAAIHCIGGTLVTKGVTQTTEELDVGIGAVGDGFRINVSPSTPVRVAGSITYQ